jgi:hypothetical protein
MKILKSKKKLLYDARLGKSGFLFMKIISTNSDSQLKTLAASVQDVLVIPAENGMPQSEQIVNNSYFNFTKEQVSAAESSFTVEPDVALSDFTEMVALTAIKQSMETTPLYSSVALDWEIVDKVENTATTLPV